MRHLLRLLIVVALLAPAAHASEMAFKGVWSAEAESCVKPSGMHFQAGVSDDPIASGGRAVRIPCPPNADNWSVVFSAPRMEMRGQVRFTLWLRGENLPPLVPGLCVALVAHDQVTGSWAFHRETRVYGANLRREGYTPIALTLDAPWTADTYGPEVILRWDAAPAGAAPVIYLDQVEIAAPELNTPRVLEVSTAKIHYRPEEQVDVAIAIVNPAAAAVAGIMVGEEIREFDIRREVFREPVRLAPGEEKSLTASYRLGPEEYGREIRVRLLVNGSAVARGREFFAVSKLPLWVAGGASGDRSFRAANSGAGSFYVGPASAQDSWRGVQYWKRMRRTYFEFFSWAPGDIADLAPSEDLFPGGEGRLAFRSRQTILEQTRMLRSVGMWPVSYVNGTCWGEPGYRLFQQHPEWFLYDASGEVAGYETDGRETYRRKDDAAFDPKSYNHIFFQGCLNHSLPEVQHYVARQFVACGRQMGFAGVRLDVRYLEVYPGERGFDGRPIATTYAEADRISAAAVRRVKSLVEQEIPGFTFGYNYAAPEEVKDMMRTFEERCRGGAWMLDELPCTYQQKSSPYHVWNAYVRRMMSWGDRVHKLGGVYNPYDFNRGTMQYPIDLIYSAIFRIICGGRDYGGWYYNSRQPVGDYGAFTTRFSQYLHHSRRDWIPEIKSLVQVKSPAPLWWSDMCFWTPADDGGRCLQVNLVNPPKVAEVMENPRSEINPPVRDITVTCAPAEGQKPVAAYLLASEPDELTDLNAIQVVTLDLHDAGGGRCSVRVPSVLFWKTVVFRFEESRQ
jgi:hypothetical protein